MQFLLTWLGTAVVQFFTTAATKIGLQLTVNLAFITFWLAVVSSFTMAAKSCFGLSGSCSAMLDASGLNSWVIFGMSLVPGEAVTIAGSLVTLRVAGWTAIAVSKIVRIKASATGLRL